MASPTPFSGQLASGCQNDLGGLCQDAPTRAAAATTTVGVATPTSPHVDDAANAKSLPSADLNAAPASTATAATTVGVVVGV